MSNPVDEFLMAKEALGEGFAKSPFGKKLIEGGGLGLAFAGMGAGVAGITEAASKIYNAITKSRDFDNMMEANPHLEYYREREPQDFNRVFSSIRSMNPEFSKDPVVAGSIMFQAMESAPEQRGFSLAKLRGDANPKKMGPLSDAAMSGFRSGIGMKLEGTHGLYHGSGHGHSELPQEFDIPAY